MILHGDCLDLLPNLDPESVDAVVTDPPAGISFMGKDWDHHKGGRDQWIAWMTGVMAECHRVLKPGGHSLVWALPRTSHWTATAIEDAGFEIRDIVLHLFGSGFPKSLDVSKAIDKAAGAEREVIGTRRLGGTAAQTEHFKANLNGGTSAGMFVDVDITAPATDAAREWDGWGTALKPAAENWILARKPLIGTVARNVQKFGTGAINVDGCRIATDDNLNGGAYAKNGNRSESPSLHAGSGMNVPGATTGKEYEPPSGRWPANVILDEDAAALLDEQSGTLTSGKPSGIQNVQSATYHQSRPGRVVTGFGDTGGASRFYYVAKASRSERNAGLDGMPEKSASERYPTLSSLNIEHQQRLPAQNHHPTVKPIALMRWLVRLVTPPGGTVLDPFMGSGSTGVACVHEGFHFIGIEQDETYAEIAERRIDHATEMAQEASARPAQLLLTGDD